MENEVRKLKDTAERSEFWRNIETAAQEVRSSPQLRQNTNELRVNYSARNGNSGKIRQ